MPGGHTWVHRDTHCFLKEQRHNRCDRPPPSEYLWLLPVQWLLRVFFFFLIRFWSHHRTKPLKGQMLMSLCHRMFAFFSVISWFPFFYPLIIKLTFQRTRSLKAFQISTDFWNSLCLLDFFFLIMLCCKWAWDVKAMHCALLLVVQLLAVLASQILKRIVHSKIKFWDSPTVQKIWGQ